MWNKFLELFWKWGDLCPPMSKLVTGSVLNHLRIFFHSKNNFISWDEWDFGKFVNWIRRSFGCCYFSQSFVFLRKVGARPCAESQSKYYSKTPSSKFEHSLMNTKTKNRHLRKNEYLTLKLSDGTQYKIKGQIDWLILRCENP